MSLGACFARHYYQGVLLIAFQAILGVWKTIWTYLDAHIEAREIPLRAVSIAHLIDYIPFLVHRATVDYWIGDQYTIIELPLS